MLEGRTGTCAYDSSPVAPVSKSGSQRSEAVFKTFNLLMLACATHSGEVGIDDALVLQSKEEVIEMNNGCICCTSKFPK